VRPEPSPPLADSGREVQQFHPSGDSFRQWENARRAGSLNTTIELHFWVVAEHPFVSRGLVHCDRGSLTAQPAIGVTIKPMELTIVRC